MADHVAFVAYLLLHTFARHLQGITSREKFLLLIGVKFKCSAGFGDGRREWPTRMADRVSKALALILPP